MKTYDLSNMVKGWFVGNFEPSTYKTEEFEVGVKYYQAGHKEPSHYHQKADEITVIISGIAAINGVEHSSNAIVFISKNEYAEFEAITDLVTVVVKTASVKGDKYIVEKS